MTERFDVILIGSGISCLVSAALLAKKGKRVVVLESHSKPGGYLHCFTRFGERYDTGAHYTGALGPGQPFRAILEYLGVYEERFFAPLDRSGFDVLHFPERTVPMPVGYAAAVESLSALFPSERAAIAEYFGRVREAVRHFPHYAFSNVTEAGDGSGAGEGAVPLAGARALDTTLEAVVESLTANEGLRSTLYAYCVLHGVRPEDAPFGFHAVMLDSLLLGAYGLAEGGDALAEKFVCVIESAGGLVKTRRRVRAIEVGPKRLARAVVTENGDRYEAEHVIAGIHPKAAYRLLDFVDGAATPLTPAFRERLGSIEESVGIFGVYGVASLPPPCVLPNGRHRNDYFFSTSDRRAIFAPLSAGPMTESALPDPTVAFLTSPKRSVDRAALSPFPFSLHAAAPVAWFEPWRDSRLGKRPPGYAELKAAYAEKIFALVERTAPGFRASVTRFATSTPLTALHYNGSEDGSAYGIYHSVGNTGARAIGPRTKIANLLLTGQNTVFPGLLGAAVSALRTSGYLVGMKPVLEELAETARASRAAAQGGTG